MRYANYHRLLSAIKKHFHFKYPLIVTRGKLGGTADATCHIKNKKFIIRIDEKLNQSETLDCVIHEVAHCLAWYKDKDDHGRNWGIAYSQVYRFFLLVMDREFR